jgi:AraC-like DNA-binding protein
MGRLTLDWIQLAAALGALQGVLLTGTLAAQKRNRTANRLLAVLMATFSIYLAQGVYYATGLYRALPHLMGIATLTPWTFGPLVYLYARAASDRDWRFTAREWLHFVPVGVALALAAPTFALGAAAKLEMLEQILAGARRPPLAWLDPLKYLSGIAYSVATVHSLRAHRRQVLDSYSNTARANLSWLLWLAGSAAAIWALATVVRVADAQLPLRDAHVSLAIALLVYAIGYMGLRQPEVFRYATAEWLIPPAADPRGQPVVPAVGPASPAARYERSGLDADVAAALERALREAMDRNAPWRDGELTLAQLATLLGTTPHRLSEALNARVGQTFYDFVNGYRVRDVQRRIAAGEARTRKMLALAMDAGFASKSTFNDAFKRHTGMTPSAYRATVGA